MPRDLPRWHADAPGLCASTAAELEEEGPTVHGGAGTPPEPVMSHLNAACEVMVEGRVGRKEARRGRPEADEVHGDCHCRQSAYREPVVATKICVGVDDYIARAEADATTADLQLDGITIWHVGQMKGLRRPQVGTHTNNHIIRDGTPVNQLSTAPDLVEIGKHGIACRQGSLRGGNLRPRVPGDVRHMCSRELLSISEAHAKGLPHSCHRPPRITAAMSSSGSVGAVRYGIDVHIVAEWIDHVLANP